jgi:L-iditol 2-dehydrogenase
MKALQFLAENRPAVSVLDVPEIAADEVLIASRSVGICHSDIELLEGRYIIPFSYPIIPGHEWAGEVVAVGERVRDIAVGDRVVGECVIGDDHFGFSIRRDRLLERRPHRDVHRRIPRAHDRRECQRE